MMKQNSYEIPVLKITVFQTEDVVRTSSVDEKVAEDFFTSRVFE